MNRIAKKQPEIWAFKMSLLLPRVARFSQSLPGVLKRTLFGMGSKSHNRKLDHEAKGVLSVIFCYD